MADGTPRWPPPSAIASSTSCTLAVRCPPAGMTDTTDTDQPIVTAWLPVAVLLGLTGLAVMSQMYTTIPLSGVIGREIGVDGAWVVLSVTTFAAACGIGFLVFGPLSDALGRRIIIAPGLLAVTAATVGVGLSDTVTELHLWRALQGLAAGTFSPPAVAYVNETMPVRLRASITAGLTTGYLLATVVGQIAAEAVSSRVGWRQVFFLSAPLYVVAAGLTALLPAAPRSTSRVAWWRRYPDMARLWTRLELRSPFIAGVPLLLGIVAVYAGLEADGIDGLFTVRLAAAPAMALALFASQAVNRFGAHRVFRVCTSTAGLALLSIPLVDDHLGLAVTTAVSSAMIAVAIPTLLSLIGQRAGAHAGSALAITTFLVLVGGSAGAPIAIGLVAIIGLTGLMLCLAAAVIGSGLLLTSTTHDPQG